MKGHSITWNPSRWTVFIIIVLLVGSTAGFGVHWLDIQYTEHNQAAQTYLQANPYEGEINQYITYIGVVGVIIDHCVEDTKGDFRKEYKLRFPSNVICNDNDNYNSCPFVEVWVQEGAIMRFWELR